MREAAIVSTARTGIGKAYRGAFNVTEAPVLAGHVMNAAVERAGIDPARIDDIFWGVGNQWGTQGANAGRLALFAGQLPQSVPAFTLDRKCGSGLTAIALAARSIIADEVDVALAGGMESISLTVTKDAPRYANESVTRHEPAAYIPMIETAEIVAERYGISRAAQDAYGAQSQQRAVAGLANGAFAEEIVPITVDKALFDKQGNRIGHETVTVTQDEGIRSGTTVEALAGLKTVWPGGQFTGPGETITAGNASQLSDGASAQILMDRATAEAEGKPILGIYRDYAGVRVTLGAGEGEPVAPPPPPRPAPAPVPKPSPAPEPPAERLISPPREPAPVPAVRPLACRTCHARRVRLLGGWAQPV